MSEQNLKVGAYTEPRCPNESDLEVFRRAMANGPLEAMYLPLEVATQVVSGVNYRFTCAEVTYFGETKLDIVDVTVLQELTCNGGKISISNILAHKESVSLDALKKA